MFTKQINGCKTYLQIALIFTVTICSNLAFSASFDCQKAGTKIEKMICSDDEISVLDERLGKAYKQVRGFLSDDSIIRSLQKQWIRNVRNKVSSLDELRLQYYLRVDELESCCEIQTDEGVSWVLLPLDHLGQDGGIQGEIATFPYLTNTANPIVKQKINSKIDELLNSTYCSTDSDPNFIGKQSTLNSWVTYSSEHVFSVQGLHSYFCGGAYPVSKPIYLNFDLQTGEQLSLSSLFKDFDTNKQNIYSGLFHKHITQSAQSNNCHEALSLQRLMSSNHHHFYLEKTGLVIEPSLIHAQSDCASQAFVDMDRIRPYFATDGVLGRLYGFTQPSKTQLIPSKDISKSTVIQTGAHLIAVASAWSELEKYSNQSQDTYIPEVGIRGRYHALSSVLSVEVVESIIGLPVFVNDTHIGQIDTDINWHHATSFGHYNPDFLVRLTQLLTLLLENKMSVYMIQPFYDSQLKQYLRTYYLTYEMAIADEKLVQGYLQAIEMEKNNPSTSSFLRKPSAYLQNTFMNYSMNMQDRGYDVYESNVVPGFWIRRKIDGTSERFYELLILVMSTFDSEMVDQL